MGAVTSVSFSPGGVLSRTAGRESPARHCRVPRRRSSVADLGGGLIYGVEGRHADLAHSSRSDGVVTVEVHLPAYERCFQAGPASRRPWVPRLRRESEGRRKLYARPSCGTTTEPLVQTPMVTTCATVGDVEDSLMFLRKKHPDAPIYAIGFSMGANMLVK